MFSVFVCNDEETVIGRRSHAFFYTTSNLSQGTAATLLGCEFEFQPDSAAAICCYDKSIGSSSYPVAERVKVVNVRASTTPATCQNPVSLIRLHSSPRSLLQDSEDHEQSDQGKVHQPQTKVLSRFRDQQSHHKGSSSSLSYRPPLPSSSVPRR